LLGRAAIANAKLAYRAFGKIFDGKRWHSLAQNGAFVQRPLWASTGTKNPDYDDVKYVEPLIGRNTVNTMPEDTIAAFADHGVAAKDSIQAGVEDAERDFGSLESCGIRMDAVAQRLLADGVSKFKEDYDTLLRNLMEKRDRMVKGTAPSKS
jgi:transaldolase